MTSLVPLEQKGRTKTRESYSHRGKYRFIAMANSDSDMNIDEAVSDIRPYQFEPLCWALPVLFSTRKVQIPTRTLTLTNIGKTKTE